MLNVTRWSPDTCGCVLEYSWDTDHPQDQRIHTPLSPVSVCDDHRVHPDPHAAVTDENTRKNIVLDAIAQNLPSLTKLDENGNKNPDLDKIQWSFDGNRKLIIQLKTAKPAEKTAIRLVLNSKFANKVDVQ